MFTLTHLDGNHKVESCEFLIHGTIDEYSRVLVFLKCQTETLLENFMEACEHFHVPTRIRTELDTENIVAARVTLEIKRLGSQSNFDRKIGTQPVD